MLGSRVLLSTATIQPSQASALFLAYQAGRKHYSQVNGEMGETRDICCAWFDEFKKPRTSIIDDLSAYEAQHNKFIDKRIHNLKNKSQPLRKAKIVPVLRGDEKTFSGVMASVIAKSIDELHRQHAVTIDDKCFSIGLVRMANITPLVHITKTLLRMLPSENTILHYCIYHSQFPLLQRSSIEKQLDSALSRQSQEKWFYESSIPKTINKHPEKHHIFVVLATPVAEVGRDHDYDWAIIEPSSMRSIIQIAGRVQRHRKCVPTTENIHILAKNYKGLKGKKPCFVNPGFESRQLSYASNDLSDLTKLSELQEPNSIPRIRAPSTWEVEAYDKQLHFTSFNGLEHCAQIMRLFGSEKEKNHAAQWWQNEVSWCGELQSLQPFRKSEPTDDFRLSNARTGRLIWQKKEAKSFPVKYSPTSDIAKQAENIQMAKGNVFWSQFNWQKEVDKLKAFTKENDEDVMHKYTHLSLKRLKPDTSEQWQQHPVMGIYKTLTKDDYENGE